MAKSTTLKYQNLTKFTFTQKLDTKYRHSNFRPTVHSPSHPFVRDLESQILKNSKKIKIKISTIIIYSDFNPRILQLLYFPIAYAYNIYIGYRQAKRRCPAAGNLSIPNDINRSSITGYTNKLFIILHIRLAKVYNHLLQSLQTHATKSN